MSQSTASRKKSKSPAGDPSHDAGQAVDQVVRIPVTQLRNHPANPDATPEEVRETAAWLQARGQDEPIVVRPVADLAGHYEVLAGKRRFAAAELLGWDSIECRIRRDLADDQAAVAFIAASNAHRHTESPIRQALMIQAMFERGMTLRQAGAIYGLESESAARNKLQLLKLPEAWQKRIISGEIPESAGRCLVPFAAHATLMDAIERAYEDDQREPWRAELWETRDGFAGSVDDVIRANVRPVQAGQTHYFGHEFGNHGCLIDLTPELEQELGVAELPLAANGTKIRVATNAERYDELQIPLIKAKRAKKAKRPDNGEDSEATAASAKQRTPAEEKAAAAKHAEQLANRITRWRHEWLRELIADRIRQNDPGHWVTVKLCLWCLVQQWGYGGQRQLRLGQLIAELAGGKLSSEYDRGGVLLALVQPVCTGSTVQELIARALVTPETNPDMPVWPHELVDTLAGDLGIDLADAWLVLQSSGKSSDRVTSLWELHSSAQLDVLGDELGIGLRMAGGKAAKIQVLGQTAKLLRLPKSVAPVEAKRKRKAK